MIKKLALIICLLVIVLHLGACQLAKEDGGLGENDRMIGVFVTQEHLDLFDFESYFSDNVSSILLDGEVKIGADSEKYNGRIYATQKQETITSEDGETHEQVDYVFEGIEGVPFFLATITYGDDGQSYYSSYAGESMHDVHVTSGDKTILEGTIYVTPKTKASFIGMYVNPVYQSADGEVYLTAGTGTSFSGNISEGMEASQTITTTEKTTDENGEVVEYSFEAKIKMAVRYPVASVAIIEMGKGNEVLGSIEYSVADLPTDYSARSDTEFVLLEERAKSPEGENIKRQILGKESNSFTVLVEGEGGLCEGRYIQLLWEQRPGSRAS